MMAYMLRADAWGHGLHGIRVIPSHYGYLTFADAAEVFRLEGMYLQRALDLPWSAITWTVEPVDF